MQPPLRGIFFNKTGQLDKALRSPARPLCPRARQRTINKNGHTPCTSRSLRVIAACPSPVQETKTPAQSFTSVGLLTAQQQRSAASHSLAPTTAERDPMPRPNVLVVLGPSKESALQLAACIIGNDPAGHYYVWCLPEEGALITGPHGPVGFNMLQLASVQAQRQGHVVHDAAIKPVLACNPSSHHPAP